MSELPDGIDSALALTVEIPAGQEGDVVWEKGGMMLGDLAVHRMYVMCDHY
jgi:hypothetical protein